jgi:hypothetical protein
MATSIGAAAAQGLESGFGLGMRVNEERRRKEQDEMQAQRQSRLDAESAEDRAFNRSRLVQQDERAAVADERNVLLNQLKMTDTELAELTNEATATVKNYGGWAAVPPEWKQDFSTREQQVRARRKDLFEKAYAPSAAEMKRRASEQWARIGAGQLSLEELPDKELAENIAVLARRPIEDFMPGANGEPSKMDQAKADIEAGMPNPQRGFSGNSELLVRGFNTLFAPEISKGVGERARDGSIIEKKEVVRLVPAPTPYPEGSFVPIVRITVRRADGATTSYEDPLTEDRSDREDADIKVLTLDGALDRFGQLSTLASAVQRPDMRKRIEKGLKEGADKTIPDFLQTVSRLNVTEPQQKIKVDRYTANGRVMEQDRDEATGKPIGQPRQIGLAGSSKDVLQATGAIPQDGGGGGRGSKPSALERKIETIDDQVAAGLITQEEGQNAKKRALGLGEGATDKPLTEGQAKANLFSKRMIESNKIIDEIGDGYSSAAINVKGAVEDMPLAGGLLGVVANLALGENEQRVEQAQRDFINAVLRRESGAVISDSEFRNARRQYFPQPGDSDKVIEQKRKNRLTAIEGMVEELPKSRRPTLDASAPPPPAAPPPATGGKSPQNPVRPGIELPRATPPRQPAAAAQQPKIAVNPKTGERLILKDGQWQPLK